MTNTNLITNKLIQKELCKLQNSMKHKPIESSNAVVSFLGNNKVITPLKRVIDLTKEKTGITTLSKALQFSALFAVKEFNNQEELETCIEHAFQKLINATYPINRYKRGFYKDCLISDETMKHLQSLLTDFIFRE